MIGELVRQTSVSIAYTYRGAGGTKLASAHGPLAEAEGYGDNLVVELAVKGPIDPDSGMVMNLMDLDRILNSVVGRIDHRYINEMSEFRDLPVTPESIAVWLREEILRVWPAEHSSRPSRLRVFEGPSTWIDLFTNPD